MKKTTTVTETRDVHICDFCNAESEYSMSHCVVCGKDVCDKCWRENMREIKVSRTWYWSTGGYPPSPEWGWACNGCSDNLTRKVDEINDLVLACKKYMGKFIRSYCDGTTAVTRELLKREEGRQKK